MKRPRIGIDLDKTLVEYTGWQGIHHIGELLPGAFEFVKRLSDEGWFIVIFSARADDKTNQEIVADWARETFPFLDERQRIIVTNIKLRELECFVDDRAIPFRGSYVDTIMDLQDYVDSKTDVQIALDERKVTT